MTASKTQPPPPRTGNLRLGLCCQFAREPIKFRTTTVTAMLRLTKRERLARLGQLCRANADALLASLEALRRNIERLPKPVRSRLTLENDDKVFSPADLLPVCADTGVPLVYDVHHHRCLPDGLSVAAAAQSARKTWKTEPLFHISSPLEGWNGPKPARHHDYIDVADFPKEWLGWPLTVEVEAKAKELAVAKLLRDLQSIDGSYA